MKKIFNSLCGKEKTKETYKNEKYSNIQKVSKLVAISINKLAIHSMEIFEKNYATIITDKQPKDLISIFTNKDLKNGIAEAKKLAYDKIFNNKRKIELELGAYTIIETLLDNLIRSTYKLYKKDESFLSFRDKRALELMGDDKPIKSNNLYKMYQRVVDYIVGMTDNHAKYVSNQLNGMG